MSRNYEYIEQLSKAFYPRLSKYFENDVNKFKKIWTPFSYFNNYKKYIPSNVCQILLISEEIGFDDSLMSGIQLILFASIIELFSTIKEHKAFNIWYKENKDKIKNKSCLRAWYIYKSEYGVMKKFRNFFINLPKKDKIKILTSIRSMSINNKFIPFCFQDLKKCYYGTYYCKGINSIQECPALKDEKIRNTSIKTIADHLYNIRSNFVHLSMIPPFSYPPPNYYIMEPVTMYSIYSNGKTNEYETTLTPRYLFELLMRYLPKLCKDYIDEIEEIEKEK